MNKRLFLLLFCLFIVMLGFGVTLPVLPFYARHLHTNVGISQGTLAIHISLLTSIYALTQFLFAPFWGYWSDRIGRRPLILLGIGGAAITQLLFALASSLTMLYIIRAIGGFLSSSMLPAATSYVSDISLECDRSRNMAWLGAAISLGVIAGPAFSGLTSREDLHFSIGLIDFKIENFAPPFLLSSILMFVTLLIAIRWLSESLIPQVNTDINDRFRIIWRNLDHTLLMLLGLTLASQFGLAVFEGTFGFYAQDQLGYGPVETGLVFMVCGLVMAVFQMVAVGFLTRHIQLICQIAVGFELMGIGIALLLLTKTIFSVLGVVSLLSLGMALISPNLAALTSKQGGHHRGVVMGLQTAASSLGQVAGPLAGGILFTWQTSFPYLFAGIFLTVIGVLIPLRRRRRN